jgi:hypothetical protein
VGEQIPSYLFRLGVYASGDGQQWAALPPLPVPGATATRMGLTDILGVDAAGKLYAFGAGTRSGVVIASGAQYPDLSQQWLWIWDPAASRWEQFPTPLAQPFPHCGALCWQGTLTHGPGGSTYVWASEAAGLYGTGADRLYRVLVR